MSKVDYVTAKAANGPGLYDWLRTQGLLELASIKHGKRLRTWRQGASADFYAVDRILIAVGLHPQDMPDDLWMDTHIKPKGLVCIGCGTPFESAKRGAPRKWCSQKCRRKGAVAA